MNIELREKVLNFLVTCRTEIFEDTKLPPQDLYDFLNSNYTNDELENFVIFHYEGRKDLIHELI